ncbi:MAG: MATE family efflux transporter [Lachnospiraceae bacterium]|nr:MATE family efflux transporter [Lachnospiraceae bacterium]
MGKLSIRENKYIGNKAFYSTLLAVAVPIMIQNGISNFVNLLDNLMIGRVGTNALSGVAIANQIMFVYYLLIFGASAGVGIFTAQYHGCNDTEGVRVSFRFKLLANTFLTLVAVAILFIFREPLIELFLKGEGEVSDAQETLRIGIIYTEIMLIGLIPVGLTNAWAGTLRETGQTRVPMIASLIAIFVNLCGNALLIYGLFGLPALGAAGAAIATVFSRFVELAVLIIYTASHSKEHPFIVGAFKNFRVPFRLAKKFALKSLPLMANESLWALGQAFLTQCFSYRSLDAVAAINIQSTLWNLMGVSFLAMGDAVGILLGQILGSGNIKKARDDARKMIAFSVACGAFFGLLMMLAAPFFPLLYKTSDEIRHMATLLILISGLLMPAFACTHASYFTIRSGGNTLITFIFDCFYTWLIAVPAAFIISRFTDISVVLMIGIVNGLETIKCAIGLGMVRSGIWAKNIVKS